MISEIKGLFQLPSGRYLPMGFNIIDKLWWIFVPGVIVNVAWPVGEVTIDESMPKWDWTIGPSRYVIDSADPNDHYRPWLEKNVGRQGWDWDWGVLGNDAAENRLTIKVRKKYAKCAIIIAMRWS